MIIETNELFTIEKLNNPRMNDFSFPTITLLHVDQGTLFICVDDNNFELAQNHVFLFNTINRASIRSNNTSNTVISLIHLNLYKVHYYLEKPFVIYSNLQKHDSNDWFCLCREVERIVNMYANPNDNSQSKLTRTTLFCSLLNAMMPFLLSEQEIINPEAPAIMTDIFWYIQHHYKEPITLQQLSKHFYISDSTLSRWMKQYFGFTFEKYIRKLRATSCALEIGNTDKTMIEIAYTYGFSNPAAMNKAFHEFYQMTPGEYRKQHQPHWEKGTVYSTQ